ncbi:MAG: S41 family peptidase [Verrucomicrobia bacterium]|nr:S41 family peptidase [Verrucomicrobiota bacterium]
MKLTSILFALALGAGPMGVFAADDAPKPGAPAKIEPLDLSNLPAVTAALQSLYLDPSVLSDKKLNEAAARGVLGHLGLGAKILDAKSGAAKNGVPDIAKTETFGDEIFYVRLGKLGHDTAKALDAALSVVPCEKLNGIILDLRFVAGSDFTDAAAMAGRFLAKGTLLFTLKGAKRPTSTFSATHEKPCTATPLIVLVNHETAGSAEALAAVFDNQQRGATIGNTTAGEAVERTELPLVGGKKLALAVAEVVLPGGKKIFPQGLEPDVAVKVELAVERKLLLGANAQKNLRASLEPTVVKHRINEAELVRSLDTGDGKSEGKKPAEPKKGEPAPVKETRNENAKVEQPADIALSRALDILKGLRILRRS